MPSVTLFTRAADPYSVRMREFLRRKGVRFEEVVVTDDDPDSFQRLVEQTGEVDCPQLVVGGFVGDYEAVTSLDLQGKFDDLVE